jgi:tRNA threonylcarbamoyladenosine biosynthesis protein TsaE
MQLMNRTYSLDEIVDLAKTLRGFTSISKVMTFEGDLGAGKTTLISAMCKNLGVKDVVGSPTFSIINEYQFEEDDKGWPVYHIDLYRLEDEEEAQQAGIEDCLFSGHLCLVEWPQKVPSVLPEEFILVQLTTEGETLRRICVQSVKNGKLIN